MSGKILFFVTFLSFYFLPLVTCECVIENGAGSRFVGAFQEFGGELYQMPELTKFTFETDSSVYLICPGGFE